MFTPGHMFYSLSSATLIDSNTVMDTRIPWKEPTATVLKNMPTQERSSEAATVIKPLNLLDLPIDILKEIVDHVILHTLCIISCVLLTYIS
jgi:hypothetical protein